MTSIELRFLANRYHGTAWGRHVNEGVAEWPPSPYRLLRAMYDAWKRKCADLSENEIRDVFAALASKPPKFSLPKAVASHTRSYLNSNTGDNADKSLIFDAFVALSPEASCFVQWDVSLNKGQEQILNRLLASLNYLGRSESWVQARVTQGSAEGFLCAPALENDGSKEIVYVACAASPVDYGTKQPWFDALTYSTNRILKERLSGPPAMQYIPYSIDADAVTTWLPSRVRTPRKRLSAAVLELHGKVLPIATDTIRVAERVRGRLMRLLEVKGPIPAMVHGKDEAGLPLRDHSHLFILPRANRLGRIDHVLIYTRYEKGFAEGVADAIANVRKIVWIEPMRATAAWMGSLDDRQIFVGARRVMSATPFVTTRHWRKGRGDEREFMHNEIQRECLNHRLPKPTIKEIDRIGSFEISKFRRNREGEPSRKGFAFALEFDEEVQAPFSLGYGCHFGLGQFKGA